MVFKVLMLFGIIKQLLTGMSIASLLSPEIPTITRGEAECNSWCREEQKACKIRPTGGTWLYRTDGMLLSCMKKNKKRNS